MRTPWKRKKEEMSHRVRTSERRFKLPRVTKAEKLKSKREREGLVRKFWI